MTLSLINAVRIILLILFLYLFLCSIENDKANKTKLENDPYTIIDTKKTFDSLPLEERIKIESVIDNYFTKRNMNKSQCSKIKKSMIEGFTRGALGGLIINASLGNIANSAITFSVMNGIMKLFTLNNPSNTFILQNSFT